MKKQENKIIIYKAPDTGVEIASTVEGDTIWLTQKQIVDLFQTTQPVISRHLSNIFATGELDKKSNMQKTHNAFSDKPVAEYSLDAIISVGYRVNSKKATQFRVWATTTLRKYLIDGYAINQKRLAEQERKLLDIQRTVEIIRDKSKKQELSGHESELLDILSDYTKSLILLNKYDSNELKIGQVNRYIRYEINVEDTEKIVDAIKMDKSINKTKSGLFGQFRDRTSMKGILGAINQTFDGRELYSSIEEKASHLLYLVIKDHPFVDGNKRIGSILFLYYLKQNGCLYGKQGQPVITENTIVALALLIAASDPIEKENIIKLIINLISN